MEPKISVIVPIYNVEKYFNRCVNSLIHQTLKEIEIIFVDDGSPDRCPILCDELADKYDNFRVVHKENQGLGLARNTGLEVARGEYVAFLDSDDYVEPTMYEKLFLQAKRYNADFVGCDFSFHLNSGKDIPIHAYKENKEYYGSDTHQLFIDMLGAPSSYHSDVVYQMSVWKGIYRLSLLNQYHIRFPSERELIAEDIVFHTEFFKYTSRVCYFPEALYYYCENEKSLTKTYKLDRYLCEIKLYNYLETATIGYLDSKARLQRTFLGRIRVCLKDAYSIDSKEAEETIDSIIENMEIQKVAEEYDVSDMYLPFKVFILLLRKRSRRLIRLFFKVLSLKR